MPVRAAPNGSLGAGREAVLMSQLERCSRQAGEHLGSLHSPPCCLQIDFQSKALLTVQVICKFKEDTIKQMKANQEQTSHH